MTPKPVLPSDTNSNLLEKGLEYIPAWDVTVDLYHIESQNVVIPIESLRYHEASVFVGAATSYVAIHIKPSVLARELLGPHNALPQ